MRRFTDQNNRIFRASVSAFLALAMVAAALFAFPVSGVRAESGEIKKLKANLEGVRSALKQVESSRSALASKENKLSGELAFLASRTKEQREAYDAALEQKQYALMALEEDRAACVTAAENFENKKAEYGKRISQMFGWQHKSVFDILFSSDDLEGFFMTLRFMKMVSDADEQALDDLNAASELAEAIQVESEANYASSLALVAEADRVLSEIQNQASLTKESLDQVKAQLTNYRQKQEQLQKDAINAQTRLSTQEKLEKDRREREAREKALKEAQEAAAKKANEKKNNTPVTPPKTVVSTGMFIWPCPGYYRVTSPFGPRSMFGRHFHEGVDIGAPTGAAAVAMADGVVIARAKRAHSGNYVIIQHTTGVATRYYHLSGFNCTVGQRVKAGQVIGYVGMTGDATGPHLHFEVRINGLPVNGMRYFR